MGRGIFFKASAVAVIWVGVMTELKVEGQQVLAAPPLDFSGLAPSMRTTGTNVPGALPSIAVPAANEALVRLGPADIRPHLLYRFLYGDGIPAAPGQHAITAINELYPGVLIGLGSHWRLDYTPVVRFYSNKQFQDGVDQSVSLAGGTSYKDWTLGFSQSYASSSQPLVETGAQTDQETFDTGLSGTYQVNTAVSLELGLDQNFRFVGESAPGQALTDSRTWSTLDWLNYQVSPRLGTAIGVGFTYDDLSVGTDMTSEQMQGRVTWRPGEKLFLSASGGFEVRQFLDAGASDAVNPLFGLSASYHLFEQTTVALAASHTVTPSFFENQISEGTTVSASLHQRLLGRLMLDLGGGYTLTTYHGATSTLQQVRDDHGTFFNVRLGLEIFKRGTVSIFYQETENTSSDAGFGLLSRQGGVELGWRW